jgi:hypothetical protein
MSQQKVYVVPARHDAPVLDPITHRPLESSGAWKPRNSFWLRRIRFGEVVESVPPAAEKAPKQKPAKLDPDKE